MAKFPPFAVKVPDPAIVREELPLSFLNEIPAEFVADINVLFPEKFSVKFEIVSYPLKYKAEPAAGPGLSLLERSMFTLFNVIVIFHRLQLCFRLLYSHLL